MLLSCLRVEVFDVIDYVSTSIHVICVDASQGENKMAAPSQTSSMDSTEQAEAKVLAYGHLQRGRVLSRDQSWRSAGSAN